jgi:hypothetical protein
MVRRTACGGDISIQVAGANATVVLGNVTPAKSSFRKRGA